MKARVKAFFKNFWNVIKRPDMAILPGQLAFFLGLSIVPTVTLIGFVATRLNLSMDFIYSFLSKTFNADIASFIVPTLSDAPGLKFVLYLILGYIIASNGAASIIVTSNAIYNIPNGNYFKRRLKAIVMTFFLVLLFTFILIVPVFGDKIILLLEYINISSKVTENIIVTFNVLKGPVSWFIMFLLIKIIFTMAPDRKIPSSYVNYGAIFTTVFWVLVTMAYSFYINDVANYNLFYGGAANIVILLLWVYLLSYIFVIGMALNYREEKIKLEKTGQIETNK